MRIGGCQIVWPNGWVRASEETVRLNASGLVQRILMLRLRLGRRRSPALAYDSQRIFGEVPAAETLTIALTVVNVFPALVST